MIVQNAITNLVSFLDNIMVGQLGTEQMSGVAIVNQLIFVYNLAIFGAVSAASIFGAQYFEQEITKVICIHSGLSCTRYFVTVFVIGLFLTKGSALISAVFDRYKWYRSNGSGIAVWIRISWYYAF
ncbi:MAG: MATE family efflux transporter [Mediterraneibacter gnavus]